MPGCRPLTSEEVNIVLDSFWGRFSARNKALFLLGIKSGFRISELLSLRVGDVATSVAPPRLVERVRVLRRHMKGKSESRTVILHPEASAALEDWIADLAGEGLAGKRDYVFRSRKGVNRPISRVQAWRVLREIFDAGGMAGSLGTHSMRKTFADRVYDRLDHDLVKTQRALGHKNINSTVSYLSFRQEEIDEAILGI